MADVVGTLAGQPVFDVGNGNLSTWRINRGQRQRVVFADSTMLPANYHTMNRARLAGPQAGGGQGISLEVTTDGLLTAAKDLRANILRRFQRAALKGALNDWATRSGWPGLMTRFDPSMSWRLSLTERSENYQKRQRKLYGKATPYFSPWRSPKIDGRPVPHIRDALRNPGGIRVTAKNQPGLVIAELKLPGARKLNLLNRVSVARSRRHLRNARRGQTSTTAQIASIKDLSVYRAEFLRIDHPSNADDKAWILEEAKRRFLAKLQELAANPGRWRAAATARDAEDAA